MLKKGHLLIVCLFVGVVALGSKITIWLYNNRNSGTSYELTLYGQTQESLSFSLTDVVPGDSVSYTVGVRGEKAKPYTLTVRFEGEGSLAPFVDVTVAKDGVGQTATLAEWLAGKATTFIVDFSTEEKKEITFTYAMGLDVGDEAQNAEADFRLVFFAKEGE